MDLLEQRREPSKRLGVGCRVATIQLGIATRVHAELEEYPLPLGLVLAAPTEVASHRLERVGAREISGAPLVLLSPFLDSPFEQGEKQVGLAAELAVHDALREPRLFGDRVDRRPAVAVLQEDGHRRLEQQLPVAFDLFGSAETSAHLDIKYY